MLGATYVAQAYRTLLADELPAQLTACTLRLNNTLTTDHIPAVKRFTPEDRYGLVGSLNDTPMVMVTVLTAGPVRRHDFTQGTLGDPTENQQWSRRWTLQVCGAVNLTKTMEKAWRAIGVDSWSATRYARDTLALAIEEVLLGHQRLNDYMQTIEGSVLQSFTGAADPEASQKYREVVFDLTCTTIETLTRDAIGWVDPDLTFITVHVDAEPTP